MATSNNIQSDNEKGEIYVPDLGVSLRRLFAVAATGYRETGKRQWKLVYKNAAVGTLRVKDAHLKTERFNLKGSKNGRPQDSTATGACTNATAAQAAEGACVVVDQGPSGTDTAPDSSGLEADGQ